MLCVQNCESRPSPTTAPATAAGRHGPFQCRLPLVFFVSSSRLASTAALASASAIVALVSVAGRSSDGEGRKIRPQNQAKEEKRNASQRKGLVVLRQKKKKKKRGGASLEGRKSKRAVVPIDSLDPMLRWCQAGGRDRKTSVGVQRIRSRQSSSTG